MKNLITFGEIMMRLSTKGYLRFSQANSFDIIYGGGEANVAISLANFGIPVEKKIEANENRTNNCRRDVCVRAVAELVYYELLQQQCR